MAKKKMGKKDAQFYNGVTCALAILRNWGISTEYHEIVCAVGYEDLVYASKAYGDWEFDKEHLEEYSRNFLEEDS